MTDIEKINEMIEMQKKLDSAIEQDKGIKYGSSKYCYDGLSYAILDELGELNHELKSNWCWWKNTQELPNQHKVLEELVDVWHFVMSLHYHEVKTKIDTAIIADLMNFSSKAILRMILDTVMLSKPHVDCHIMELLIVYSKKVGFSISEIYDEYIEKNQENYHRIEVGY
jgi:dimeric dUTPase (all-alpha-NTP-PPase superfamily)